MGRWGALWLFRTNCQLLWYTDKVWEGLILSPSAWQQLPLALLGKHDACCSEQFIGKGRMRWRNERQDSALALGRVQSFWKSNRKWKRLGKLKAAKDIRRENSDKWLFRDFSKGLLMVSPLIYQGSNSAAAISTHLNQPLGLAAWRLMPFILSKKQVFLLRADFQTGTVSWVQQ